jgi:hypothetical protein
MTEIKERFDALDKELENIDLMFKERFEALNKTLDKLETSLSEFEQKLDKIDIDPSSE